MDIDARVPRTIGSTLLLFGAFVVGAGLHGVLVKGTLEPTSLPFVLSLVVGGGLIYAGWRLENTFDPSELLPTDETDEEEFDESLSPLSESDMEGRDRDDSYDG